MFGFVEELNQAGKKPETRIGVFVCHCGENIARTVQVQRVVDFASQLPDAVVSTDYPYLYAVILGKGAFRTPPVSRRQRRDGVDLVFERDETVGGLAGSFEAFKAACSQAGIYLLDELTEDPRLLVNALSMLTTQKPATGRRVAVIGSGPAGLPCAQQLNTAGHQVTVALPRYRSVRDSRLKASTMNFTSSLSGP